MAWSLKDQLLLNGLSNRAPSNINVLVFLDGIVIGGVGFATPYGHLGMAGTITANTIELWKGKGESKV